MKFVSPSQRGTTCQWRCPGSPAPAAFPWFRPILYPCGRSIRSSTAIARRTVSTARSGRPPRARRASPGGPGGRPAGGRYCTGTGSGRRPNAAAARRRGYRGPRPPAPPGPGRGSSRARPRPTPSDSRMYCARQGAQSRSMDRRRSERPPRPEDPAGPPEEPAPHVDDAPRDYRSVLDDSTIGPRLSRSSLENPSRSSGRAELCRGSIRTTSRPDGIRAVPKPGRTSAQRAESRDHAPPGRLQRAART